MSLFDKLFKKKSAVQLSAQAVDITLDSVDAITLLENHANGLLDDRAFFISFAKVNIFYSTPFGDHKDGGQRLFALSAQDQSAYLPLFTSSERAVEFYEKVGRCGFLIAEGSLESFLENTKEMNAGNTPVKLGVVIDPGYYGVTISANAIDTVVNLIKQTFFTMVQC
jgi:hypothetical protein